MVWQPDYRIYRDYIGKNYVFDYKSVQEAFESQFPHQTRLQRKAFSKSDFYRQNLSYSLFLCYFCGMNPSLHKRRTETPP